MILQKNTANRLGIFVFYDKDGIEDKVNINDYEVGFVLEKVSTK